MEEARFRVSIREITFCKQELNWLFVKYKRLENNPLYGIRTIVGDTILSVSILACSVIAVCLLVLNWAWGYGVGS